MLRLCVDIYIRYGLDSGTRHFGEVRHALDTTTRLFCELRRELDTGSSHFRKFDTPARILPDYLYPVHQNT